MECDNSDTVIPNGDELPTLEEPSGESILHDSSAPDEALVPQTAAEETPSVVEPVYYPEYQCEQPWTLICGSHKEFESTKAQGFLKGCKWSPDGTCLLTCGDDGMMRLFDLPADLYNSHKTIYQGCSANELSPSLRIKESEIVYDYCWHPHMSSWNPETCLLASTAKGSPTHLWDAYKGTLAATYRSYNHVDEIEAANSVCISPDGEKLYCGFDKCVRVFDVQIPGRHCQTRLSKSTDGYSASQSGIISCIAVNPALVSVYAAASYLKTIGLYSEPDGTALCVLEGHRGGVTHLKFSPDGLVLYSGGRKDPEILCWDLRNPGQVLYTINRTVETNQRIYFDLDPSGRYLISGDTNGNVTMWDTQTGVETDGESPRLLEMCRWKLNDDCTNGVSFHPWLPVVATSSGQRHLTCRSVFNDDDDSSESETESFKSPSRENSIKLWWAGQTHRQDDIKTATRLD
nr:EOG090X06W9 [Scapholeberis mucronata]